MLEFLRKKKPDAMHQISGDITDGIFSLFVRACKKIGVTEIYTREGKIKKWTVVYKLAFWATAKILGKEGAK